MAERKDILMGRLRSGEPLGQGEQFRLTMLLAWPSILAQLAMCLMSYIDAAMVGRLGSGQAAAVGLVSSTAWIFASFCYANSSGFSVQVAHRCGARDFSGAERTFRNGIFVTLGISVLLAALAVAIHGALPRWLGGSPEILADASAYFLIYALFLPVMQLAIFCEASLIASGNAKVSGITSIAMCVLDVAFNYLFIFVLHKGAAGAALGTGIAELCASAFGLIYILTRSKELRGTAEEDPMEEKDALNRSAQATTQWVNKQAFGIAWPLWIQNLVTRGAYIAATVIIAPLGTIAIAANSFAIIAEGFCYLPGYGMQDAATTLVGQSLGAGRRDLARKFSRITILSGASMMAALAVLMARRAVPEDRGVRGVLLRHQHSRLRLLHRRRRHPGPEPHQPAQHVGHPHRPGAPAHPRNGAPGLLGGNGHGAHRQGNHLRGAHPPRPLDEYPPH